VATEVWANLASAVVTSGGTDAPSAGTVETWTLSGSTFPAISSSASPATIAYASDPAAPSEVFLITNVSGSTATVTRGADGTAPVAHAAGFTIDQVYAAATLRALQESASLDIAGLPSKTSLASGDLAVIADSADGNALKQVTAGTAAKAFASLAGDKVSAQLYGADPTGATAIDTVFNDIVSGFGSQGGEVFLGEGTFKISSGLLAELAANQTVTIRGAAGLATILEYYGGGDAVRLYNPNTWTSGTPMSWRAGIKDLTIDGTNASAGAAALHAGDIGLIEANVIIQNFTGAGSTGLHMDNSVTWTEEADVRAAVINCTQPVVFEVTTGYNSFGYGRYDFTIISETNQQGGVALKNGANLYNGSLRVRGDFTAGSSTTAAAVLKMSGTAPSGTPNAGDGCQLGAMKLDIQVECGSGTHAPQTVYLDSNAFAGGCYGSLVFNPGTFATATAPAGQFGFNGVIIGDPVLNPGSLGSWVTLGAPHALTTYGSYYDGYFPTAAADIMFTLLDGGDSTVYLNYSGVNGGDTLGAPQRVILVIQQPSSGGPYPLAWPSNSSPTTASPTVAWGGGAPPVLQTCPNGLDFIELVTYDGKTWAGQHIGSWGTATDQAVTLQPRAQRVTLTSPFSSGTGTGAQNVTGMSAYLQTGTYRLRGWFPCQFETTDASTQTFGWTFGGTVTSAVIKWASVSSGTTATYKTAAGTSNTALTTVSPAITMSSTGLWMEFDALVTVSAGLQVTSGSSGDEVTVPAGAYLDIEPLA
jgi:hypothetical protein